MFSFLADRQLNAHIAGPFPQRALPPKAIGLRGALRFNPAACVDAGIALSLRGLQVSLLLKSILCS
jgi:hypothetical protein